MFGIYFLIVVVAFISLQIGCKDKIVDPPIKNPREYTWTVDTIAYPGSYQTMMTDIWASSSNNVYIVGHNDGAFGKMYHYDGKKWQPVDLAFGISSLWSIYGFGHNNIWAVGHRSDYNPNPPPNFLFSSKILQFDGIKWKENSVNAIGTLQSVWGSSPTDIWAGGTDGTLFHYDGGVWKKFYFPDSIWFGSIAGFSSTEVYATAYTLGQYSLDTYYFLRWNGNAWNIEDSFQQSVIEEDRFGRKLVPLSGRLYSVGSGVFEKMSSGWQRIFVDRPKAFLSLCGTSANNFFAVGNYGLVYHFNGSDWFQYKQLLDDIHYCDCWTDGKEVFIVGFSGGGHKSIVLRGK